MSSLETSWSTWVWLEWTTCPCVHGWRALKGKRILIKQVLLENSSKKQLLVAIWWSYIEVQQWQNNWLASLLLQPLFDPQVPRSKWANGENWAKSSFLAWFDVQSSWKCIKGWVSSKAKVTFLFSYLRLWFSCSLAFVLSFILGCHVDNDQRLVLAKQYGQWRA